MDPETRKEAISLMGQMSEEEKEDAIALAYRMYREVLMYGGPFISFDTREELIQFFDYHEN